MATEMNPNEPPQSGDLPPNKPFKRLSAVLVILIGTLLAVGMFGLGQ
ncbi:MAG: hypothetical protein WKF77_11065 [Planctomycetaceae bacterium]